LASTDNLALSPTGGVDYASTAYAIISMAAAGVAGDQITASATAMAASQETFIGAPDEAYMKSTALALMIIAMSKADLDPTHFTTATGSRDLVGELRGATNEDGSVGNWSSAYSQGFAIMAFLTTLRGADEEHLEWLLAQPCADPSSPGYGGYGFSGPLDCSDVDPDSTAIAMIALMAAAVDPSKVAASRTYLLSVQDEDGGFVSPFSGANANTTGLAMAAISMSSTSLSSVDRADVQAQLDRGSQYLGRLIYGCDQAGSTATSPVVGAMAYDLASRASLQIDPLTPETQAGLFQASAQGLLGLTLTTIPTVYPPSTSVPGVELCNSVPDNTPHPSSTATPPVTGEDQGSLWNSPLLWALGASLLAVVIFLGWWLLRSSRKES
jgi:hypothetical protein